MEYVGLLLLVVLVLYAALQPTLLLHSEGLEQELQVWGPGKVFIV